MRAATIWIDLDNAPHAHFFAPIVRDLRMRGQKLVITVRAFGQTEPLARSYGMECTSIGMHATDLTSAGRAAETLTRAARLIPFGMRYRPDVAVSHGSRALTIAAAVLGIPCMALYDYEHVSAGLFHRLCRRVLVPRTVLHQDTRKTIGYPGLKEDVYIHDFVPDADILQRLAIDPGKALVTVRPPPPLGRTTTMSTRPTCSAPSWSIYDNSRTFKFSFSREPRNKRPSCIGISKCIARRFV